MFNIINHQGNVRVHFTHARMAVIKVQNETDDIKFSEDGQKLEPGCMLVVEM